MMASLNKKAFSIFLVVFGLFAGLGLFVSGEENFSREVSTKIQAPQGEFFYGEVPSSPSVYMESRIFGGAQGRDVPPALTLWSGFRGAQSLQILAIARGESASARSFEHPKDYYVYTLERILC